MTRVSTTTMTAGCHRIMIPSRMSCQSRRCSPPHRGRKQSGGLGAAADVAVHAERAAPWYAELAWHTQRDYRLAQVACTVDATGSEHCPARGCGSSGTGRLRGRSGDNEAVACIHEPTASHDKISLLFILQGPSYVPYTKITPLSWTIPPYITAL